MRHEDDWGATGVAAFIDYPESDGEPIGETDVHIGAILYLRSALRFVFRHTERVYAAANMLFYYEEGNPSAVRAPDVFAVRGIEKRDRRVYKLWEEGAAPSLIVEVTSRKTRLEDLGTKRALYEMLGVQEYVLFDPLAEYLSPRMQAMTLEDGSYRARSLSRETFESEALGIVLRAEGVLLRVLDSQTGLPVPDLGEAAERAGLEAEIARTQTELARIQTARAEAETARAEAEAARAEAQAARAEAAEHELARVREELEAVRRQISRDQGAS